MDDDEYVQSLSTVYIRCIKARARVCHKPTSPPPPRSTALIAKTPRPIGLPQTDRNTRQRKETRRTRWRTARCQRVVEDGRIRMCLIVFEEC